MVNNKQKDYSVEITRKDVIINPKLRPIENIIKEAQARTTGIIQMDLIGLFDLIIQIDIFVNENNKKICNDIDERIRLIKQDIQLIKESKKNHPYLLIRRNAELSLLKELKKELLENQFQNE